MLSMSSSMTANCAIQICKRSSKILTNLQRVAVTTSTSGETGTSQTVTSADLEFEALAAPIPSFPSIMSI
jgi:hypothetical protein